jgi:alpha-beta hydrolase superfamily lysophospholipase
MQTLMFPDDAHYWFETVRVIGQSAYGAADFGEVVATATKITAGDHDSWHDAWAATADRLADEASTASEATARDLLLRAATYYRTAEYFLHGSPEDSRINHAYERSVDCFQRSQPDLERVEIPYEGNVLYGYFYRAPGPDPKPLILMHNGFDGTVEELHALGAAAGPARGYHVLAFDGPGQPSAIHRHGLTFRPDWENAVGPVIDFTTDDPAVDDGRIAIWGMSLGGYLAPRAAAFDSRISAVVAVDGIYDAGWSVGGFIPLAYEELKSRISATDDSNLEAILETARASSSAYRFLCDQGRYAMGANTDREFIEKFLQYNLMDGVAEKISCPVLVCEASTDIFFSGESSTQPGPRGLYSHLRSPKTLLTFTEDEGADLHCHYGAQRLAAGRIYDWLDRTFSLMRVH